MGYLFNKKLYSGFSEAGKAVIIALMFIGRLGPIPFLSMLQSWQKQEHYSWPESNIIEGDELSLP